jgi:hypothetical protein
VGPKKKSSLCKNSPSAMTLIRSAEDDSRCKWESSRIDVPLVSLTSQFPTSMKSDLTNDRIEEPAFDSRRVRKIHGGEEMGSAYMTPVLAHKAANDKSFCVSMVEN